MTMMDKTTPRCATSPHNEDGGEESPTGPAGLTADTENGNINVDVTGEDYTTCRNTDDNDDDDDDDDNNNNRNNTDNGNNPSTISRDELVELVRAIKFAKPDASQRAVHREIVQEIPTKFPQFAVLRDCVQCKDVRRVWKEALQQQQQPSAKAGGDNNNNNADLADRLRTMSMNGAQPQLYTVGAGGGTAIATTATDAAREYVAAYLSSQPGDDDAAVGGGSVGGSQELQDYVHVFLNVPADTSGTRPHQALINFQTNVGPSATTTTATSGTKKGGTGNKKKQHGKKRGQGGPSGAAQRSSLPTPAAVVTTDDGENDGHTPPFANATIVKIQMAQPIDEHDTAKHPMLVYDQSRTYKTFVHPNNNNNSSSSSSNSNNNNNQNGTDDNDVDDDDGYMRIARWIQKEGVGGALGQAGGTKAYFYARVTKPQTITKTSTSKMEDILSIYVKSLAPTQPW